MKTIKLYRSNCIKVIAMLMAVMAMAACTDEEIISGTVEDGTPVAVSFQISLPQQNVVVSSRSMSDETANKVENLYILGFNTDGEKAFGFYYTTELKDGSKTTLDSKETIPSGIYDIYAIANIDSDVYGVDENTDNTNNSNNLKSFLDAATLTKEALLTKAVSILTSARSLDRSGSSMLMAGALCNANGKANSVHINTKGQVLKTINLKRLDSEITFNFKAKEESNISFTAKRWHVMNAPAKSFLIEDDTKDAANEDTDFYNTYQEKEEDRASVYNNTFTFYMPENRKVSKDGCNNYSDREKEMKKDGGLNDVDPTTQRRNYKYAPNNGTYVVVTGHYEGPGKSTDTTIGSMPSVVAEVQYIIHLGYVANVANDFFSKRNTKYTYNVTVSGVDNIILEVEKEKEEQPGATGDVIFGGGNNIYTLDAHYETVLLTFYYDELKEAWGKGQFPDLFTAVANTPYTAMTSNPEEDMKWVQVVRNEGATEKFEYYPSPKSKLQSVQQMLNDLKDAVISNKPDRVFSPKDGIYVATYTCFIDEFYYEKEDLPTGAYEQLPDKTNIWKSFVNRPNRKMYIICNRQESADKESSIISSKYVLSQRSIQTFYSTEPTPNETVIAYGIETLNETGNLPDDGAMAAPNRDNGWANTQKILTDLRVSWNDIDDGINGYKSLEMNKTVNDHANLNPKAEGTDKTSNYLRAMTKKPIAGEQVQALTYSCMQRNRIESSSRDAIDDADLKWYLPAINQYQSFYIGEPALSQESRLFDYPGINEPITGQAYQFIKHYGSSTKLKEGSANNLLVFWAEEATSVSTLAQQLSWATPPGPSAGNPEAPLWRRAALSYRCVRNLGKDDKNKKGEYTPYRTTIKNPAERVAIKVDKLNPLLRSRGRTTGELAPHFYQEKGNYFYTNGFEVESADKCNLLITTLGRATGVITKDGTGCEKLNENLQPGEAKWRVPNLRELTLMWQEGVINEFYGKSRSTARTQMPYRYNSSTWWYRNGWLVTDTDGGTNLGMSSSPSHPVTVRCVRDLK